MDRAFAVRIQGLRATQSKSSGISADVEWVRGLPQYNLYEYFSYFVVFVMAGLSEKSVAAKFCFSA